ncbi:MAG: hypothetical protein K2M08_00915 [Anaeroplasmataceae bacterium]|nr:hypothetical protein [Anaeroplasmataceae bacterium]
MDLFEEWLSKKDGSVMIQRALTAQSYKNVDHSLKDKDISFELATYGDALIKFCYAEIFLDKCKQLSKEIEKYVTDERWVSVIAKHYSLLDFIRYDKNDKSIKKDYVYVKPTKTESGKNKKESPHKYIATAVEAMIGVIYLKTKDLNAITELLISWSKL